MLSRVSNKTLGKVAIYGLVACLGEITYLRYKQQMRVRDNEYFKQAMKHINSSPGAIKLLGSPIKDTNIDLGDEEKNFCDGKTAKFAVSVKGPLNKGTMFFWSTNTDNGWQLDEMELEVNSQKDRRYLVKKTS